MVDWWFPTERTGEEYSVIEILPEISKDEHPTNYFVLNTVQEIHNKYDF